MSIPIPPTASAVFASINWSSTPMGPMNGWPNRLRTTAESVLANRYPMVVLWGSDFIQVVYNDAYAALIGPRHPVAMGQPSALTFPQDWAAGQPVYARVLREGREEFIEDVLRPRERGGRLEEVYLTVSYNPLRDDAGNAGGVLVTAVETTRGVLAERRLRSLRELAARTARVRSVGAIGELAARVFANYRSDLTFGVVSATVAERAEGSEVSHARAVYYSGLDAVDAGDLETIARAVTSDGGSGSIELATRRNGEAYPAGSFDQAVHDAYVAALPRAGGGEPLGYVVLGLSPALPRDDRYREYLELLTAQLAAAFDNAAVFSREHLIAETLQRAALPVTLPVIARLAIDAVYEAGSDEALIGGDWYDAFELGDGRVAISIGDVAGSGVAAAAAMGAARQMIRALAQTLDNPVAILDAVDRAFRLQNPELIVTAFVGLLSADHSRLRYASAGHPPPFVRHADGRIEMLFAPNLPIGLRDGGSASSAETALHPGSIVVLYTDGLTEATHDPIEGERRLRAALRNGSFIGHERKAAHLYGEVLDSRANDDVALLVIELQSVETPSGRLRPPHEEDSQQPSNVNDNAAGTTLMREI